MDRSGGLVSLQRAPVFNERMGFAGWFSKTFQLLCPSDHAKLPLSRFCSNLEVPL